MLDCEEDDGVSELPGSAAQLSELAQSVLDQKKANPSRFVSHWEMDENDVDEATEEDIKNDPEKRVLWAAEKGERDLVHEMLDGAPDLVHATDSDGYTPLHRAAYEGHADIVQLLLERGAAVDARTEDGWTALHSAANWGQACTATVLLHHGADINARTHGLHTPLHLAACSAKTPDILKLLLTDALLDTTAVNQLGETARDVALRHCPYHHLFASAEPCANVL